MSRRSSSTPDLYGPSSAQKKRGKGSSSSGSNKVRAPRMLSFAAATERQFSARHTQQLADEMRSVPGKGLARRRTQYLARDELDEEVHVHSKTVNAAASHTPTHSHTHPSSPSSLAQSPPASDKTGVSLTGGNIVLKRSGSMTQYEAMCEHLAAIKFLDMEENDEENDEEEEKEGGASKTAELGSDSPVTSLHKSTELRKVSKEELKQEASGEPTVLLTESPSTSQRKKNFGDKTRTASSDQIRIRLNSFVDNKDLTSLDAKTIDVCRQQSTVRVGNTVLFPLVLVPQPEIFRRFDLACADFKTWKHFTDGSNSHIYKAKCTDSVSSVSATKPQVLKTGMKIIVKALKDSELQNSIALQEFDSERELLASISHPNILAFLGSGVDLCDSLTKMNSEGSDVSSGSRAEMNRGNSMKHMLEGRAKVFPRPFLVLERLNGGSLALLLAQHQQNHSCVSFLRALEICQQLAQALDYLHNHFHKDAVLIHRDIKPDNIGFDDKGVLKLMDFGISTCIRREVLAKGPYAMTGLTGSLRYMAREVYLEKPYNQAVDVHSVGILMWHVTTCSMPFPRFTRKQFDEEVVARDLRPPVEAVLHANAQSRRPSPQVEPMVQLMQRCWAPNYEDRPDIGEVLQVLTSLLEEENMLHLASGSCC